MPEDRNISISVAGAGDNEILAAQAGKSIRLLSYTIVAAAAVVAKWKSGASTDKSGAMTMATGVPISPATPPPRHGQDRCLLETAPGEALNLNLGGAVQVSGHCTVEISP